MRTEDLKPGMRVVFGQELSERGLTWAKGDVVFIKETPMDHPTRCVRFVCAKDPTKTAWAGGAIGDFLSNATPSPFERGRGIAALTLPPAREPYVCGVTDHDLLPDP